MGSTGLNKHLAPRHLQLRDTLFRRWKTRGSRPGDKIESQNEIIKFCEFSLITVIKTLKDLEADGIIRRQVGKGSFLVKTPWAEAYWRIGFFYNRDIVGGGIFNNAFYTRMVVAIEKGVVSDGHEFILGSFTHKSMPTNIWDALDAVILTGITEETDTAGLMATSSQVNLIDVLKDNMPQHSFRLDFASPFHDMFDRFQGQNLKYLYLDSQIVSPEQAARRTGFEVAHAGNDPGAVTKIIRVNQEAAAGDTSALQGAIAEFQPDLICGYMHRDWHDLIARWAVKKTRIYAFALDSDRPGFVVDTADWMGQVLPRIYANLANRQSDAVQHIYPAKFVP
ncbi:MAG: GntR family transcriptional regulator [Alphaproteobacteria bacterium]|nr:GntR family transcriptional regulator [Alphaproteobacteria bacterium]